MASVFTIPSCSENFPRRSRSRMNSPSVQERWWPRCAASLSDPGPSQSSGHDQNTILKSHWNPKTSKKPSENHPKHSKSFLSWYTFEFLEHVWECLSNDSPCSVTQMEKALTLHPLYHSLGPNYQMKIVHRPSTTWTHQLHRSIAFKNGWCSLQPGVCFLHSGSASRCARCISLIYLSRQCPSMGENTITCWILLVEIPTPKFIMSCPLLYFKCGTLW